MSPSVLETMLPYLVIAGFLGMLYLCAFGFLIVACLRLHRVEGYRAWQIAWLATLISASLSCLLLVFFAIMNYLLVNGSLDLGIVDDASIALGHAGSFAHLTVLICLAIALASPLMKQKSPKTILPGSQA